MAARVDPDLELGGRIALQDAFSRQARAVEGSFRSLHATVTRGAGRLFQTTAALGGGFRGLAASMFGPLGLAAGLHYVVRATLESASSAESTELAFTQLLHSSQMARSHLDELRQFALGKPFEFTQLTESSRRLQTYGFNVRDVTGLLTDFGNAAFTANTGYLGVQRMTRVFGNILATGRVTFGQLNQLVTAGVPANEILRQQLNLTGDQLRNIARSGIPAERILTALRTGMQQRYAGGMDRASRTVAARLSDLQDAAEYFRVLVGQQLSDRFKGILDSIAGITGNVATLRSIARRTAEGLDVILLAVRAVVAVTIGGFRDVGAAWERDGGRFFRDARRNFENLYLVVQGVSALLSGQDARGVARIPRGLHEQLVARGLWPVALRVAAWGARVRAVIAGFVEGSVGELRRFADRARWVGDLLGITGGRMGTTREDARRFGVELARAARFALELRVAIGALNATITVATGVARVYGAVSSVLGWVWARGALSSLRMAVGVARLGISMQVSAAGHWILARASMAVAAAQARLGVAVGVTNGALAAQVGIAAAAAAAALYAYRNYDRLTNMTRRGSAGDVANATAQRVLLSALGAGGVFAVMDVVRAYQRYAPVIAGAARAAGARAAGALVAAYRWVFQGGLSGAVSRAGAAIYGALAAVGRRVLAFFEPVLRPLRIIVAATAIFAYTITAFIALGLARAGLWVARGVASIAVSVGRGLASAAAWVGRGLARIGAAVWGAFVAYVVTPLAWVGLLVWRGLATVVGAVAQVVVGAARWVARGVSAIAAAVGRAFTAAWRWIADGAFRVLVWISNPLERAVGVVARFGVRVKNLLVAAFTAVRDTVVGVFRSVGDSVLGGLRTTAGGILSLYRALPARLRPAALAGAESTLDRFARGGETPAPSPAPAPAAPAAPGVPALLAQRANAQAALTARAGGAPTVVVQAPRTPPAPVVVQIDGREVARAVTRDAEGESIRRGGHGVQD